MARPNCHAHQRIGLGGNRNGCRSKCSSGLAGCFGYASRRQVSHPATRSTDPDTIPKLAKFRNSSSNAIPTNLSLVFHQLPTIIRSPGGTGSVPFLATLIVSLVPGAALNLRVLAGQLDE